MLKRYICPDGKEIDVEKCLKKCRLKNRCLPYPYLKVVASNREYKGKVSVTQGLNGTRYNYFNIIKDIAERPHDYAFTTLGTNHHTLMEENVGEGFNGEWNQTEYYTGTPDYYDSNEKILWDFKTYKSFKIKKLLGIGFDDDGNEVIDENLAEREHEAMQLNAYRIMLEAKGIEIKKMMLCVTNKDYRKPYTPKKAETKRKVFPDKIVTVELPRIEDNIIMEFYKQKTEELNYALKHKKLPTICSDAERWNGLRCKSYCPHFKECELELKPDEELF